MNYLKIKSLIYKLKNCLNALESERKQAETGRALHLAVKEWHRKSLPFFIFLAFSPRAVPRLN